MNVEQLRAYCLSKKGVEEDFPFGEDPLVFKVMGKMFALLSLVRVPSQVNLKCEPERALELREAHDGLILPGYHMNKQLWNTVHYQQLPDNLVIELIDHSYDLIVEKFPKKLREQFNRLPED